MKMPLLALAGVLGLIATAPTTAAQADAETMIVVKTEDLKWKDYPGLPGVTFTVVSGDPSKEGLYTIRAKFAPGVMSTPHWHPEARYVTVLKGTWWAGAGEKFDPNNTVPVPTGGFAMHHPRKIHFDGAKDEEVIVQISGIGPSGTVPAESADKNKQ